MDDHRGSSCEFDLVGVGHPVGCDEDDFVSWIKEHLGCVVKRVLGSAACYDLVG